MDKQEIIARIEVIIDDPATKNDDKIALKQGCELIRQASTREQIAHAIEFLAAILAIAAVAHIL
jgi:TusA-related sulfurtransferase